MVLGHPVSSPKKIRNDVEPLEIARICCVWLVLGLVQETL